MTSLTLPALRDYYEERASMTADLTRRLLNRERGASELLVRHTLRIAEKAINARLGGQLFIELSVWVGREEPQIVAYYDTAGTVRPRSDDKRRLNAKYYREAGYDVIHLLDSPTAEPVFKERVANNNYAFLTEEQRVKIKSTFLHCIDVGMPAALVATSNKAGTLSPEQFPVDLIYTLGLAIRADLHLDILERTRSMRTKPAVFIGCSREGKDVAQKLQEALDYDVECTIWHDGVFGLSQGTLESLVNALSNFDFAVLIATPDDMVASRGNNVPSARDNVIFELGLFMGGLGRGRTYILHCRDDEINFPSDFGDIAKASFAHREDGNLLAAVRAPAGKILDEIKKLGVRRNA